MSKNPPILQEEKEQNEVRNVQEQNDENVAEVRVPLTEPENEEILLSRLLSQIWLHAKEEERKESPTEINNTAKPYGNER